jgi:hypothetical protein
MFLQRWHTIDIVVTSVDRVVVSSCRIRCVAPIFVVRSVLLRAQRFDIVVRI